MKAKINERILCIPPYLSTSWDQVIFIHAEDDAGNGTSNLIIHLIDGKIVSIKNLEPALIDLAFAAHMQFMEKREHENKTANLMQNIVNEQTLAFPLKLGLSNPGHMEGVEMTFQHNPSQAQSPPLPPEVLDKIAAIAGILTNGDLANFSKPEPHCNCMHCQVSRAIHKIPIEGIDEPLEINVTEDDLKFRSWDISQTGDKLYTVWNPLDPKEKYNVFLGTPLGCTCGDDHCEHIKAVLYS